MKIELEINPKYTETNQIQIQISVPPYLWENALALTGNPAEAQDDFFDDLELIVYDRVTGIPDKLADLMEQYAVTAGHIQHVSSEIWKYFPADMPIQDYPEDYHEWLVNNWPEAFQEIQKAC